LIPVCCLIILARGTNRNASISKESWENRSRIYGNEELVSPEELYSFQGAKTAALEGATVLLNNRRRLLGKLKRVRTGMHLHRKNKREGE